tara:strand:+ start:310 stop:1341 length:1032 start_codon:yes stop_codon:yes gene_type:complete
MITREWETLYNSLPKKNRDEYYRYLEYVAYFIQGIKDNYIYTAQVEDATGGLITARKLGKAFANISSLTPKSSSFRDGTKIKGINKYWLSELRNVLTVEGLHPKNLEQYKSSLNEPVAKIEGIDPSNAMFVVKNYKEDIKPSYNDTILDKLNVYYSQHYHTDFNIMYALARRMIDMSVPRYLPENKRWWDKNDANRFCLEFGELENNYPRINDKLLKSIYPEAFEILRSCKQELPTIYIHRLICMVANPLRDWTPKKKFVNYSKEVSDTFLEAHHICHNPRCINPNHIQALTEAEHHTLHSILKDKHYVLQREKDREEELDFTSAITTKEFGRQKIIASVTVH